MSPVPAPQPAAGGRRDDVLRVLRDSSRPLSITEIADRLGVHANTVRFHLQTLLDDGRIERTTGPADGPGRPPQLFAPVPGMDPTGPRHYRVLAEVLVASLAAETDPAARAIDAGRLWGRRRAEQDDGTPTTSDGSVAGLVGLLDELGFAPEASVTAAGDSEAGLPVIDLHHCPFLELAGARSEVVCPIHLGIMRGALESWGSPVTVDRLEPFARPDLCTTHLTLTGAS